MGGKAANIVFEDATIDQAIEGIVNGIYFNQGHVCCAGSRLLVQESVHDEVVAKLKNRINSLVVGDPLDKNTDIGAINSKSQLDTIEKYIEAGKAEGSEFYQPSCPLPEKGYWCRPTVFDDVAQSSRIAQEEIFGPVLAVQTFRTVAEVIKKANNTPYGQGVEDIQSDNSDERGRGLGEHLQPIRPNLAVWRIQGKWLWSRRWVARFVSVFEIELGSDPLWRNQKVHHRNLPVLGY